MKEEIINICYKEVVFNLFCIPHPCSRKHHSYLQGAPKKDVTTLIGYNKSVRASMKFFFSGLHSQPGWIYWHVFVFLVFQIVCKYHSIACKMYTLEKKTKIVQLWYETKSPAEVTVDSTHTRVTNPSPSVQHNKFEYTEDCAAF